MDPVLVTPRSVTKDGHPALRQLEAAGLEVRFCRPGVQPSEADLLELLPGCVGYLAGVEPITARALASADRLKVISRNGTGVDNVDLAAAATRGITICRAEGANARGVAELTMGLILSLVRSIPSGDASVKSGGWERRRGIEIEGRTLGLVGCGTIGRIVSRLALAFDMHVLAFDPFLDPGFAPSAAFQPASLERVLETADILTLHCPALPGGPVLDRAAIARLKRGAYVVNTARATLIDAEAMLEALDRGDVAGLALDVFDPEPPTDRRLAAHPRVIATPHIGGFTDESVSRAVTVAVENLIRVLKRQ